MYIDVSSLVETHFLTRPRTDGAVFMKAGYPCIDLWALGGGYYHHPKDNTQSINPDILRAATEWLYWTTIFIADRVTGYKKSRRVIALPGFFYLTDVVYVLS